MKPSKEFWEKLWELVQKDEMSIESLFGFFALACEELDEDVIEDFYPGLIEAKGR
jgi:hypothetical protein